MNRIYRVSLISGISVLILAVLSSTVFAYTYVKAYTFGGTGYENFYGLAGTSDGGFVAVGGSHSRDVDMKDYATDDYYEEEGTVYVVGTGVIVKYRSDNTKEWTRSFGSKGYESLNSVATASNGDYIAVGQFSSSSVKLTSKLTLNNQGQDDTEGIMIRYSSKGNVVWAVKYGTKNYDTLQSVAVLKDKDGSIVATGFSGSNGVILKYDSAGTHKFTRKLPTDKFGESYISSVTATSDGGFLIAGSANILNDDNYLTTNQDAFIAKYDSAGTLKWHKIYATTNNKLVTFSKAIETKDKEYIAVGGTNGVAAIGDGGYYTNYDALVIKFGTDAKNRRLEWAKLKKGANSDVYRDVVESSRNKFVAVGLSNSTDGDFAAIDRGLNDGLMIAYSNTGAEISNLTSMGGSEEDYMNAVTVKKDGKIVVAGGAWSTNGQLKGINKGQGDASFFIFK